jgi:predicted acylesterase/phospholipase RssA
MVKMNNEVNENHLSEVNHSHVQNKQRALILQGGGTLGAYEVGALKILCRKLIAVDKENGHERRLLFDIFAGTSIGAMNSAIFVSQFLETRNWEKAVDKSTNNLLFSYSNGTNALISLRYLVIE